MFSFSLVEAHIPNKRQVGLFFFGLHTTLVFKMNLSKHPVFEGLPNYLTTHRMVKNMLSKGNMLKYSNLTFDTN